MHPFEHTNLGSAPFSVIGYYKCPPRQGTCCDHCGTYIVHVYVIRGSGHADQQFKVGCDCVRKTDWTLHEACKAERKATETRIRREAALAMPATGGQLAFLAKLGVPVGSVTKGEASKLIDVALQTQRETRERERREAQAKQRETSQHVGTVGKRQDFGVVTVVATPSWETDYGTQWAILLDDAHGNRIVWRTSSPGFRNADLGPVKGNGMVWGEPGDKVRLTATVKEHGERDGVRQTTVQRAKIRS